MKRFDAAWKDLLECHRLGRVVGRGGTLIEAYIGLAIDRVASDADLAFLDNAELDAKRIKACLRDLQALPPLPFVADKVDLADRFMALELFMLVDRHGFTYLERLSSGGVDTSGKPSLANWVADLFYRNIDWDTALRNTNRWYDRVVAAARVKVRPKRRKELEQIHNDLAALRVKLMEPSGLRGSRNAPARFQGLTPLANNERLPGLRGPTDAACFLSCRPADRL